LPHPVIADNLFYKTTIIIYHNDSLQVLGILRVILPGDDGMKTGFGWVEIGGIHYDHDIVVHVGGAVTKRHKKLSKIQKKQYGHTPLSGAELVFLQDEHPEVVYVGTGQYGDLPLTPDALILLEQFSSYVKPTPDILGLVQKEKRRFTAVIHVTC